MDVLPVSMTTAIELINEYGFTLNDTYGCRKENAKMFIAFPRASMLVPTTEVCKVVLELEDVLALKVLNIDAWEAYLSKFDN